MNALDELETELLGLGAAERHALDTLDLLKQECRRLGRAGHHDAADDVYARILSTEKALALIKQRIFAIERRLYRARLR